MSKQTNVYKHVYFRTEAGYIWGTDRPGMPEGTSEAFHAEVKGIFDLLGWKVTVPARSSGSAMTATKGVQKLYLHPQSFSGVVAERTIKEIEGALKGAATFKHTSTDVIEDVYDITTEEYLEMLNRVKSLVEDELLIAYKTKRSNLYHVGVGLCNRIAKGIELKRAGDSCNGIKEDGVASAFVVEMMENMVKDGRIIRGQARTGAAYRTANAKELKARGKSK